MQDRGGAFIQGRVEALDTASKSVRLLGPNGVEQSLEYDTLVYALGSQTDLTRVPGAAQYAVGLRIRGTTAGTGRKNRAGAQLRTGCRSGRFIRRRAQPRPLNVAAIERGKY